MTEDLADLRQVHAGAQRRGVYLRIRMKAFGYRCVASLPEGASGFTTVELKTNFVGTALDGRVVAQARLAHGGRTTQVWDAVVSDGARAG